MVEFFVPRKITGGLIIAIVATMATASCTKQSEDVLISQQHSVTCDTMNMKFSVNVTPIFIANCYRCHANSIVNAGVSLDVYSSVVTQVNNGNLIGDITHTPGHVAMPYDGGKLSDCEIAIIQAWINEGAPNN